MCELQTSARKCPSLKTMLRKERTRLLFSTLSSVNSRFYSSGRTVKEYDVLFLRQQGPKHAKWHLTPPIRPDSRVRLNYGATVAAEDLIGRNILDKVADNRGRAVTIHEPSLASYITNSERLATPIYPHDAHTIVSLLDLNPVRAGEEEEDPGAQPFEIFEAGTGMGSLTLHIARAIHAANPPLSPQLRQALCSSPMTRDVDANTTVPSIQLDEELNLALSSYNKSRRAILHTLDLNHKRVRAAYRLVRNFRRAQYLADIDFHLCSIDEYIGSRLQASNGEPVFSRAILDLPSPQDHTDKLVDALHPNAILIVFNPSISQIAEFHAWSTLNKKPLRLEKVLELPTTTINDGVHDGSSGGRHWAVMNVRPKAESGHDESPGRIVQVMRPKVGDRVGGGGFVGVFRRWPVGSTASEESQLEEDESD